MESPENLLDTSLYRELRALLEEAVALHGSVANLSRRAGINHSSLADWLHGRQHRLSSETLARLFDYLDIHLTTPRRRRPPGS